MNDADSSMRNSAKKRHGMGVMSAKLFSAMVGGMTTSSLYDFDVLKGVGSEFKDVFSDKDFEGKDSSYPYSQEYYEDMRDKGKMMLSRAWDNAIDSVRGVNLDGSSGSEAVRQARMNIGNMIKAPKKVEIGNDNQIINIDRNNTKGDETLMKKIIVLVILAMTVVGCELLDPSGWERARQKDAERGVRCYKDQYGNMYCKDKNGNNAYQCILQRYKIGKYELKK